MLVEICVSCVKALNLASKYGADRVELCQELSCGGLTPSIALVKRSVALGMNTQVLIRPRSGDFVYDEDEKIQMMEDVVHYQKLGMHESKIVTRFWIVGIMLAVITIVTLKIR